ncbi:MAG: hypothetical protein KIS30_02105 [Thermoplasmata archaeon]|nr:hypothetical protein [Candidatus Sysuiplasma acidicola]MBX8636753.1 hypothetical protein [Candidatus Sysuiplasma acidicola]MBX8645539.1 hypothetical protein [Candidatus Sysuiplasma acidicola]MDH2904939.1 hypothetical protein [Methanomassiliicoccales archaeon]
MSIQKNRASPVRITSSQIATFVYCARKYSISVSLPPDYVEPAAVRERKQGGVVYHRTKGRVMMKLRLRRLILLAAGMLALAGAMIIWLR